MTKIQIDTIVSPLLKKRKVRLEILRLDLIHPQISGNKWFKLKYNLDEAVNAGHKSVLSFGGAFSNHIHALAFAAKEKGLESIGIIRGEKEAASNPTLTFAKDNGMHFEFVDRTTYRLRNDPIFLDGIKEKFDNPYIIPEGGSNHLAVKGCAEIAELVRSDYDYVTTSVGTGGTLAGLVVGFKNRSTMLGFSSLKGDFLQKEVQSLLPIEHDYLDFEIISDYHFEGYAKFDEELILFMNQFKAEHSIELDPIYTGKMLYGLFDMIEKQKLDGSNILAVHTGGLQGRNGFNLRYGNILD